MRERVIEIKGYRSGWDGKGWGKRSLSYELYDREHSYSHNKS